MKDRVACSVQVKDKSQEASTTQHSKIIRLLILTTTICLNSHSIQAVTPKGDTQTSKGFWNHVSDAVQNITNNWNTSQWNPFGDHAISNHGSQRNSVSMSDPYGILRTTPWVSEDDLDLSPSKKQDSVNLRKLPSLDNMFDSGDEHNIYEDDFDTTTPSTPQTYKPPVIDNNNNNANNNESFDIEIPNETTKKPTLIEEHYLNTQGYDGYEGETDEATTPTMVEKPTISITNPQDSYEDDYEAHETYKELPQEKKVYPSYQNDPEAPPHQNGSEPKEESYQDFGSERIDLPNPYDAPMQNANPPQVEEAAANEIGGQEQEEIVYQPPIVQNPPIEQNPPLEHPVAPIVEQPVQPEVIHIARNEGEEGFEEFFEEYEEQDQPGHNVNFQNAQPPAPPAQQNPAGEGEQEEQEYNPPVPPQQEPVPPEAPQQAPEEGPVENNPTEAPVPETPEEPTPPPAPPAAAPKPKKIGCPRVVGLSCYEDGSSETPDSPTDQMPEPTTPTVSHALTLDVIEHLQMNRTIINQELDFHRVEKWKLWGASFKTNKQQRGTIIGFSGKNLGGAFTQSHSKDVQTYIFTLYGSNNESMLALNKILISGQLSLGKYLIGDTAKMLGSGYLNGGYLFEIKHLNLVPNLGIAYDYTQELKKLSVMPGMKLELNSITDFRLTPTLGIGTQYINGSITIDKFDWINLNAGYDYNFKYNRRMFYIKFNAKL